LGFLEPSYEENIKQGRKGNEKLRRRRSAHPRKKNRKAEK